MLEVIVITNLKRLKGYDHVSILILALNQKTSNFRLLTILLFYLLYLHILNLLSTILYFLSHYIYVRLLRCNYTYVYFFFISSCSNVCFECLKKRFFSFYRSIIWELVLNYCVHKLGTYLHMTQFFVTRNCKCLIQYLWYKTQTVSLVYIFCRIFSCKTVNLTRKHFQKGIRIIPQLYINCFF